MSFIEQALGSTQLSLLWICAVVAAMVFAALVYSTATFRPTPGATEPRRRSALLEVVWSVVPIFIVVAAALPAMTAAMPVESTKRLVTENRVACETAEVAPERLMTLNGKSTCAQQR
jgi:heme/copper-type cytochrome/quinol oxidase subunit 2